MHGWKGCMHVWMEKNVCTDGKDVYIYGWKGCMHVWIERMYAYEWKGCMHAWMERILHVWTEGTTA